MAPLRKILAENIERHKAAAHLAREAASTAAKAIEFVKQSEHAIMSFKILDEKIAAERACSIKSALAAGERPQFELSADLANSVAELFEAQNQLAAARQASAALATEASDAAAEQRRALEQVQSYASAVVNEDIDNLALAIQTHEAAATGLRIRLHSAEKLAKHLPGGGARFSKLATMVMFASSPKELIDGTLTSGRLVTDATIGAWREYFDTLCTDATATLEPEVA
jgi:hypothetical protein